MIVCRLKVPAMKKEDLIKYINGESDEKECLRISEWINKSESNRKFFNCLKESYIIMKLPNERATEEEFAEFAGRFAIEQELPKPAHKNIFHRKWIKTGSAVAAIFVIALLVTISFISDNASEYNIISNNTNSIILQNLPDGSTIGLSPQSELQYSTNYGQTNRNLKLSGICYFDVAKNRELPFTIETAGNIKITVTGTKFYASSGRRNSSHNASDSGKYDLLEIALKEGSVSVTGNNMPDISLEEGDYLQVKDDLSATKSKMEEQDLADIMGDMLKYLSFRDACLKDVIERISIVHNCKIKIADPEIAQYLLTADLTDNTLEDILLIFDATMGVKSKISESGEIELY